MAHTSSRLASSFAMPGIARTPMPKLVYGTAWKKDRTDDLVYKALVKGFRGIDTAAQPKHYQEKLVGDGLRRALASKECSGLDGQPLTRQDVFVQSKFTPPSGQSEECPYDQSASLIDQVHQSVKSSLENFTVPNEQPYLDSLVLHSPMGTIEETLTVWSTLEGYYPNQIRNLGMANTTLPIVKAVADAAKVKPAVVQNRFHDRTMFEVKLRAYCRQHNIVFQSFWTLTANNAMMRCRPVQQVAQGANVSAVAAYYSLVLGLEGVCILDGTTKETHMQEDLAGIQVVGKWAEGGGASQWESSLDDFKTMIGEGRRD